MADIPKHIQLINQETENKTGKLNLGNCGLTQIPEEVFELTWLTHLVMSNNMEWNEDENNYFSTYTTIEPPNILNKIPIALNKLPHIEILLLNGSRQNTWQITKIENLDSLLALQTLGLNNNRITKIENLDSLTALQTLYLYNNEIAKIENLESLTALQTLGLSHNQITKIENLDSLPALQTLGLNNNRITKIQNLSSLTALQTLYLYNNEIAKIENLESLTALQTLGLSHNQITKIENLDSLPALQTLELSHNQITKIENLDSLTTLQMLDLDSNQLTKIENLESLTALQLLHLSHNKITKIENLDSLTALQTLYLYNNKITKIENLDSLTYLETLNLESNSINELKGLHINNNLKSVNLDFNSINILIDLPDFMGLDKVSLTGNPIRRIEKSVIDKFFLKLNEFDLTKFIRIVALCKNTIVRAQRFEEAAALRDLEKKYSNLTHEKIDKIQLNKLYDIYISVISQFLNVLFGEYQLEYPPINVLKSGIIKTLEFYEQIDLYGQEPLFEAKLLIVGEPAAGKTSLRKKLYDINYKIPNEELNETIGVYVQSGYNFPYYKDTSKSINVNLWDFGGQEKQYPLHQYFLKDKSVYALLSSDREDNQYLDKWFSIIRLLSGNDNEIVLVLNQKNRASGSSNFNKQKYEQQGFKFKEHILDFSKDTERFEVLKSNIEMAIANLPHIGEMYPKYCKTIADKIDTLRFTGKKDYLTFEEYEKACIDLGLHEKDVPQKALDYLSIIGKVIHYSDDCNLERIVIINPHWLIDAIYGVLTCGELDEFHNKGRFTKKWFVNFLTKESINKPSGYKESEALHILNLMLKNHFDICYELNDTYLIPLCMPEALPANNFDESNCLQLMFKYSVMPSGMVARILVRLSDLIYEEFISKSSGILKRNKNFAKIEEYYLPNDANKYVRILVNGDISERKSFLEIIKRELIKVQNDWFENLKEIELIPCICSECKDSKQPNYFELIKLRKALEKEKFVISCDKSYEDINIFELTGEVYDTGIKTKIESINDLENYINKDELNITQLNNVFIVLGENTNFSNLINMGDNFTISGNNPNSQFGGSGNTQYNFQNCFLERIDKIIADLTSNKNNFNEESKSEINEILKDLFEVSKIKEEVEAKGMFAEILSRVKHFWSTTKSETEKHLAKTLIISPIGDLLKKVKWNDLHHQLIEFINQIK